MQDRSGKLSCVEEGWRLSAVVEASSIVLFSSCEHPAGDLLEPPLIKSAERFEWIVRGRESDSLETCVAVLDARRAHVLCLEEQKTIRILKT